MLLLTITLGCPTLIYQILRALQYQKEHLIKREKKIVSTNSITTFFDLIITLIEFSSCCINDLQKKNCVIINICASWYTKMFYVWIWRQWLHEEVYIKNIHMLHLQCIEKIFLIWKSKYNDLKNLPLDLHKKASCHKVRI